MTRNLNSNGTFYRISGTKSSVTLVFIHGLGLNKNMWVNQIVDLEKENKILCYDLYGHGQSKIADDQPSLTLFTEQLYSVLYDLRLSKVILIGFSLGGMIARHFTQKYGSLVSGLVILNSPHKRTKIAQDAVYRRYLQVCNNGPSSTVDEAIKRWFTPSFELNNKKKINLVRSWVLANDPNIYCKNYKVLLEGVEEITDLPGSIKCPTLIITSEGDFGNGPQMSRNISAEISGSKVIILPKLKHMALFEDPKKVNKYLRDFIWKI